MPDFSEQYRAIADRAGLDLLQVPVPYNIRARYSDGDSSALGGFPPDGYRPESPLIPFITAGAGVAFHPFQLIRSGTDIRIIYGTVNSDIPTGMSPGDDPPYTFTPASGTTIAYVKVTTDASPPFDITDVSLGQASSLPADTSTEWYQELGSVSVSGSDISIGQSVSGSLRFALCGGAIPEFWGV